MSLFSAKLARKRLIDLFPGESVIELEGNPNILGEYVFLVGSDKRIAVNADAIIEEEEGMPNQI